MGLLVFPGWAGWAAGIGALVYVLWWMRGVLAEQGRESRLSRRRAAQGSQRRGRRDEDLAGKQQSRE